MHEKQPLSFPIYREVTMLGHLGTRTHTPRCLDPGWTDSMTATACPQGGLMGCNFARPVQNHVVSCPRFPTTRPCFGEFVVGSNQDHSSQSSAKAEVRHGWLYSRHELAQVVLVWGFLGFGDTVCFVTSMSVARGACLGAVQSSIRFGTSRFGLNIRR